MSELHLYASKESELRKKLKDMILPQLSMINYSKFELSIVEGHIDELLDQSTIQEYERQATYMIIDILLIEILNNNNNNIEDAINFLLDKFRHYIVLHEVAALSWGDKILTPDQVFDLITKVDISQKHIYHILNEMSVSYPQETVSFTKELITRKILDQEVLLQLKEKMILARKEGRTLAKGVIPQLSQDEIQSFFS